MQGPTFKKNDPIQFKPKAIREKFEELREQFHEVLFIDTQSRHVLILRCSISSASLNRAKRVSRHLPSCQTYRPRRS